MNLAQTDTSLFKRLRFILVDTSHPGNIGAVARAIKTMGFSQLILVNPRFEDALTHPDAIAFASGAQDVLQSTKIVSHIDEALVDCHYVAAVSARLREFSPPIFSAREFSEKVTVNQDINAALVFGSERFGLPNEIVLKSDVLINIATNPDYSSLNLAQAVQILAYECRMTELNMIELSRSSLNHLKTESLVGFKGSHASKEQLEGMYQHLEHALVEINFLDPDNPKKLMPRLKRLFARSDLELEEVNLLRGMAQHIIRYKK